MFALAHIVSFVIELHSIRAAIPINRFIGRIHVVGQLLNFLMVVGFLACIGTKYRMALSADAKRRLRVLYAGTAAGLIPLIVLFTFASLKGVTPEQYFPEWLMATAYLAFLLLPLTLAYVVVVQRAMDVRVVIRQGLQYTLARRGVLILRVLLKMCIRDSLLTVSGLSCVNAFAQGQPIRVAIVGLEHGHVSGFLKQFPNQHEVQLVGIVDADTTLSHRYAEKFHLDPSLFYTQLDPMIAARHPQALLVYTSVGGHRAVIEAAAERGLSVMVEKPLTMSLADALAIRQVARQHHVEVLVNYETTWYASNRAAYDEAANGALGDLRRICLLYTSRCV